MNKELLNKVLEYEKLFTFYDKLKSFVDIKLIKGKILARCKFCGEETEIGVKENINIKNNPNLSKFAPMTIPDLVVYRPWYEIHHRVSNCVLHKAIFFLRQTIEFPKYSDNIKDFLPSSPKESENKDETST